MTSITFSWNPAIAVYPTTGYNLMCIPLLEGIPIPEALMLGPAATTANMTGLYSGVIYSCSIITINTEGISQPQVLTFNIMENGTHLS